MSELAKYRVKIAGEVELGAEDNLVEGTEVTVSAESPQIALCLALAEAVQPMLSQMDVDAVAYMQSQLQRTMKTFSDVLGVELPDTPSEEDLPDASEEPAVMPLCKCGHRYDHHEHDPLVPHCKLECECDGYSPTGETL